MLYHVDWVAKRCGQTQQRCAPLGDLHHEQAGRHIAVSGR
jgi:hypothetical protein